ncbi:MAG: hypothetical protein ACR2GK_01735 [Gemmatimonadaceae bacterium]
MSTFEEKFRASISVGVAIFRITPRQMNQAVVRIAVFAISLAFADTAAAQSVDSLWTIRGGSHAGITVRIDVEAASREGRFWRLSKGYGSPRIVGWIPSRLPVAVAFQRGSGISAADSAAFWSTLRLLEADLGMHLFEPATLALGGDPEDVVVVGIRARSGSDGLTLVTWDGFGSLYDARVFLRSRATLHDRRIVTHEMMHALGFGHTTAWASVMTPSYHQLARLTALDVAYAQAAIASRAAAEREDMWSRLALAVSREPESFTGYDACEPFSLPVRFPGECTFFPCSAPSASCGAARNTGPLPGR